MKHTLFISACVGYLCCVAQMSAQSVSVKPLEVLSTHTATQRPLGEGEDKLYSTEGMEVGQFARVETDTGFHYRISIDGGSSFDVDALSNVVANVAAQRLYCYGTPAYRCTVYEAAMRVYDLQSGALLQDLGRVVEWPFDVKFAKNGEFVLAGQTKSGLFELQRYSVDGDLLWSKPIAGSHMFKVWLSADGSRCALGTAASPGQSASIGCYDALGNLLGENRAVARFAECTFWGNDKVLVSTNRTLYMYDLTGTQLLGYYQFSSDILGERALVVSPAGDFLAVVTATDAGQFRVSMLNSQLVLTHETELDGPAARYPWRIISFQGDGALKFVSEELEVTLRRSL